jgi:DNA invertase Pin-like site-specific DNA recombinase
MERDWCQAREYTLTHLFIDRARSGGSTIGRTEFDRLIKYFQSKPPEAGVVFWDLSRWARNIDDGQYYLAAIRRLGTAVVEFRL